MRTATDEVRSTALCFASGRATEQEFVEMLLALDAKKLRPHGVDLVVSHTEDGWLTVMMKHAVTHKVVSAFEFRPESSQIRRFGQLEQYSPALRPECRRLRA